MKKGISMVLAFLILFTCVFTGPPDIYASEKAGVSRAIAIVFDNSGSMYVNGEKAWCRATYAMEVFASMLNKGDTLLIYPMHAISVDGKEYTMDSPLKITDAAEAEKIREIFTEKASGTPIESVDSAAKDLETIKADKKYMIVLTDGDAFYLNGAAMGKTETRRQLDMRFSEQIEKGVAVMYLGIGNNVVMPDTEASEFFVKQQASNSEDVLSVLTDMCNLIFGRDNLPDKNVSGNSIEFDISMSKLIIFVQGENVSGVTLSGSSGEAGKRVSEYFTKYGTAGCGNYESSPDTSLQGMMVTYSDCPAGTYTVDYSGSATNIEIYYEPDADLDFVFTDIAGNSVNPNALYEGNYKVSFGMKDAKTGKLIESELLGNPIYKGTVSINGNAQEVSHEGYSGEIPVSLEMDDTFDAKLTVTYLSGYTITKDSSDFGWNEGGIKVAAMPAGNLLLEISGGAESYSLQDLPLGEPFTAKVYYEGKQLTGKELEKVELRWDSDTSNADINKDFQEDHYDLHLGYKDPDFPENTVCGECTVTIYAHYTPKGSSEAITETTVTYNIIDDFSPLKMDLDVPKSYIVISRIEDSEPMMVNITLDGEKIPPSDFSNVALDVNCGGLEYEIIPDENNSAFAIKLLPSEKIEEGDYKVDVTAVYTDHIGRETSVQDSDRLTLSNTPLWLKWLIGLLLLLILLIIILIILHIKVLPKRAKVNKRDSTMIFDGEDETKSTSFNAEMKKGQMVLNSKYAGTKTGISMDVTPGKESYLRKPNARRSAEVKSASVRKYGSAVIQEATVGSVRYILNEDSGKLERVPKSDKPFMLKHGTTISYSGTMLNGGVPKPFNVTTKLNFKKK